MSEEAARRLVWLARMTARDSVHAGLESLAGRLRQVPADAIGAGVRWLCLSHDVTGRHGSSKGYSLLRGWLPPFPETTGYVIGTLLAAGRRAGDDDLFERARQMGDWEIEVQCKDGGVMEGHLTTPPKPSTVFNTGMVMHGWLDLHEWCSRDEYLEAAVRAGNFLRDNQDDDGAWRGEVEYFRIPHTYCSRVSWALMRLAAATGDASYREAARRQLDWVVRMQRENGWFECASFEPRKRPNTHGIAYTLRGLLESYAIEQHEPYLAAVKRTSEVLIGKLDRQGRLPATFDSSWEPAARYECLTGTVQLGGVWLRLYELTDDARFLRAGLTAVERAAANQVRTGWECVNGAIPGSNPIYGRYAPLQFPNWATKFLVDGLMRRESLVARLAG